MNKEYIEIQLKLYANYPQYCEYLLTVCEYLKRRNNVLICGNPGVGKSILILDFLKKNLD